MTSAALALLVGFVLVLPGSLEDRTAKELIERVEDILRGSTARMLTTMVVETPRWRREIRFRSWDDRARDRSFTRILAPRKDRGTGFLQEHHHLWTYLPRVERVMRIPPSMMFQPWMGSDFTNDDIARDSSFARDYAPRLIGERTVDGMSLVGIELVPHEEAPVVWARLEVWLDPEGLAPRRIYYFDEPEPGRFERVRTMRLEEVRMVQGRPLPHLWVMVPEHKPGHRTTFRIEEIRFDDPLGDALFTLENLRRAEAVR